MVKSEKCELLRKTGPDELRDWLDHVINEQIFGAFGIPVEVRFGVDSGFESREVAYENIQLLRAAWHDQLVIVDIVEISLVSMLLELKVVH